MAQRVTGTESLERFGLVVAVLVGALALLAALGLAMSRFGFLAGPLVVAGVVVIAADPLVTRLVRRGLRRGPAVLIVLLGGLVLTTASLAVLVPMLVAQWQGILDELPGLLAEAEEWLIGWGAANNVDTERFLAIAVDLAANFQSGNGPAVGLGLATVAVSVTLGLVLGAAAVLGLPDFKATVRGVVPERLQPRALALAGDAGRAITGFIRGQLVIALIVGLLISLGLALLDVPFWLVLGSIAGIGNLVPFMGPIVGGIPAAFIALTSRGLGTALAAVILMVVVQLIESYLLSPLILYRTVRVRPLVVILAILTGWSVFGLLGMLLAVPAAAVVKVLGAHSLSWAGLRPVPGSSAGPGLTPGHR